MEQTHQQEYLKKLGNRVTSLRTGQKLTKVQLAYEIESSESYVRKLEQGQINPKALTLAKLAKVLNVSVGDLFDF